MGPSLLAIRAIAIELALRIFRPTAIIVGSVSVVAVGAMVWLISLDALWWLLAIPVFLAVIVGLTVTVLIGVVIYFLTPNRTKEQKSRVAGFVYKIQHLSEVTQTPKIILLFRIAKDMFVPSKGGFIHGVIADTSSLKDDFKDVLNAFK